MTTAKETAALAPGFSENHNDKNNHSTFRTSGNNIIAAHKHNENTDDASSVIGASLLPFIPSSRSNRNSPKRYGNVGDALSRDEAGNMETGAGRVNGVAPGNNATLCGNRKRYYNKENRDRINSNECLSLILDGRTTSTDGGSGDDRRRRQQQERKRHQTRTSRKRKRILLRGPPGSGKTSLGMNMAYAEAAADYDCCEGIPCGCVAVIVYRPIRRRQNDTNGHDDDNGSDFEQFPLFCRVLPQQIEEVNRVNTNAHNHMTNDRMNEGLDAVTARGKEAIAATKGDGGDAWDPDTLNRIRICRVSSLRDLWEDLLVLAGKPPQEQPTRAIVIEDLDQIIGSGNSSGSNKNQNQNHLVSMMLKTMAIAADTALAIDNCQNAYESSSSSLNGITLLVTLTTDSRNSSAPKVRSAVSNATDLSDALAVASCIDTVLTLHQIPWDTNDMALEINKNDGGDASSSVWKKPMNTATRRTAEMTRSGEKDEAPNTYNKQKSNKNSLVDETVLVDSVWQAEIQERGCDQYYHNNIVDDYNDDSRIGVSLVDYAFVESYLAEGDNCGSGKYEGNKELRWKHCN